MKNKRSKTKIKKRNMYFQITITYISSLEKEIATHSSILAWRIPWKEESGGLQSVGVTKSWTRLSDFTAAYLIIQLTYSK